MGTEDNINTTKAIARECGILIDDGIDIKGPNFREKSMAELNDLIPKLQVHLEYLEAGVAIIVTSSYQVGKFNWDRRLWEASSQDLSKGGYLPLSCSCIPLITIAGGVMAVMIGKAPASGQNAYAKALIFVEQSIDGIRTIVSFTGEKQAVVDYKRAIVCAYHSTVHQRLASGRGLGTMFFVIFGSYALALTICFIALAMYLI